MSIYTPFTYLITHIPTGKRYYGVRYRKGCHPSDIGTKYFSSSKVIKKMIAEDGLDKFKFEVRRTFANADKAIDWEVRILTRLRVWENDTWFNQSNGGKKFTRLGCTLSDASRKKMSDSLKKIKPSEKTIKKRNESIRKAYQDPETRKKANAYINKTYDEIVSMIENSRNAKKVKGYKHSKEIYERVANLNKGRIHNKDSRQKMIEAWRIRKAMEFLKTYDKRRPLGPYADQIRYYSL